MLAYSAFRSVWEIDISTAAVPIGQRFVVGSRRWRRWRLSWLCFHQGRLEDRCCRKCRIVIIIIFLLPRGYRCIFRLRDLIVSTLGNRSSSREETRSAIPDPEGAEGADILPVEKRSTPSHPVVINLNMSSLNVKRIKASMIRTDLLRRDISSVKKGRLAWTGDCYPCRTLHLFDRLNSFLLAYRT